MFSSKKQEIPVFLVPHPSAQKLSGFALGNQLRLIANSGETLEMVIQRFNEYRGPEQQIKRLWDHDGAPVNMGMRLYAPTYLLVRAESVNTF